MTYKRILLKLSGESLAEKGSNGISANRLQVYVKQIQDALSLGAQVGIVLGGGNLFRGVSGTQQGVDRVQGDYMGMLATVINGLGLQSTLQQANISAELYTAFEVGFINKPFIKHQVIADLEAGRVTIFAGGTGNPFFTTDSAAALRGIQIEADILLKGTRVDGVYSADPEKHSNATRYDTLSFDEVIEKQLEIMDMTAFTLCRENQLPILVYNSEDDENLLRILKGEKIGTVIR